MKLRVFVAKFSRSSLTSVIQARLLVLIMDRLEGLDSGYVAQLNQNVLDGQILLVR